jgi:hypothetical protein
MSPVVLCQRKKKIEKKRKLEESWAMARWLTSYLEDNEEDWETWRRMRETDQR